MQKFQKLSGIANIVQFVNENAGIRIPPQIFSSVRTWLKEADKEL